MAKSFRRPPKNQRRRPLKEVSEEQRVLVTKTPEMVSKGFHPERSLLAKGWEIDEKTRSKDGQSFEMKISPEKYNANRAKNQARTDAMAGSKPILDHDSVEAVSVRTERISGATIRRELEALPSENTAD